MGKDITTIVHQLDKTALVVGPSPSTGNQFGIHFLPSYYAAGGAPYQDIVGLHAYLYNGSSFATVPEGIVDSISQLKLLMSNNGISGLPIFFTEGSWGGPPNNASLTDDQKVAYLARDYVLMWDGGIARYYWYAWDNSGWGTLYDGALEPAGAAYQRVGGWLTGSSHTQGSCVLGNDATYTCPLVYLGQPAQIVWNTTSTPALAVGSFGHYHTLDSDVTSAVVSGQVTLGPKPILLVP